MKNKNILLLSFIFLLILSLTTYGQIKKEVKIFKGEGPEMEIIEDEDILLPPLGRIIDRLDLTESQEKEFRKLNYDLQKKQTDLRAKIRTAQIELRELLDSEKIDRTAIEKKIKDIADLKLKLQMNRLDHWFAVNKILDEKQQKIWKEHFKKSGPEFMREFKKFGRGERFRDRIRCW
ncbi:MAG: hypothetical protein IGBAC_1625 [Ignavibacteriae bacterium]|nr:MAG: hypothetical protein IGBAC_1625 [Ignavibacteriota bacterium]